MKKLAFLKLLAVVLVGSAQAATYTYNNGSGAVANGIGDSSGRVFRGGTTIDAALGGTNGGISAGPGVVAVGVFSTDDLSTLSSTQLLAAFTIFGAQPAGTTGTFSASGGAGSRGIFSLSEPAVTITNNTTFSGKNMYLLVGNGTTLSGSTEFLVLKNSTLFAPSDDSIVTGVTVSFTAANSTLLFGTNSTDIRTTSTDSSVTPGWRTMAPVPEPSAALLGMLGALGLLRRRR